MSIGSFGKLWYIPGNLEDYLHAQACAYAQERTKKAYTLTSDWYWGSAQAGSEG